MSEMQHSHLWPGVPLALGSAVLFGLLTPASSLLLGAVSPFMLAALLYLGTGVGMGVVAAARHLRGFQNEAQLGRKDLPWLALAVGAGGIVAPVLLMVGLARSSASVSSLLLNVEGLATLAIAWLLYKENVDRKLFMGALAILAGAMLLTTSSGTMSSDAGAPFIIAACIFWGLDNNFTRKISAADPVIISTVKGLVGGITNLVAALAVGEALPSLTTVAGVGLLGFACIGMSLTMFILALRHLGTARTGAYYALAPFIGALLSVSFLHEPLTLKLLIAALLMGFGLWLHLTEDHVHEHQHEVLEHEHSHVHDEHHKHDHDGRVDEPHSHSHRHAPMRHKHPHFPDIHHRHSHKGS